jgi:hypothetical protein
MKSVLLDENLPKQLKGLLSEFNVVTVPQAGWSGKKNGDLLRSADGQFDVLLTVDKGIKYQNNFTGLRIAVVQMYVKSNRLVDIMPILRVVKDAIVSSKTGQIIIVP